MHLQGEEGRNISKSPVTDRTGAFARGGAFSIGVLRYFMELVAPVVQLATPKPSLTLGREFESRCSHTNWNFSSYIYILIPTSRGRSIRGYTKFEFTVDEGKGRLNPSHDKYYGKQRRKKVEKSCVTFLLCDPGWCVHKCATQKKGGEILCGLPPV